MGLFFFWFFSSSFLVKNWTLPAVLEKIEIKKKLSSFFREGG